MSEIVRYRCTDRCQASHRHVHEWATTTTDDVPKDAGAEYEWMTAEGEYGDDGNRAYLVCTQNVVAVDAPDELRRISVGVAMTTAPMETWTPRGHAEADTWAVPAMIYSGIGGEYAVTDDEMAQAARAFGAEALDWAETTTEAVAESWPTSQHAGRVK